MLRVLVLDHATASRTDQANRTGDGGRYVETVCGFCNNEIRMAMSKDSEWSGLEKVPDKEIIKNLRVEIGKLKSYIVGLEYRIAKNAASKSVASRIHNLEGEIKNLKKRESDTLALHNTIEHLRKEVFRLTKQIESP